MNIIYKNTIILSIAHVAGYVIPLIEIPILARTLGPVSYGNVIFFQSSALLSSLIIEYGFNLSASRQIAISQNNKALLSRIFFDVLLAKIMLSFFVLSIIAFILFFLITINGIFYEKNMIIWSLVYLFAFGFSPFWYFQGRERMIGVVILDLFLRLIGLSMLFLFVKSNKDAVLALAIMSSVGLINTALSTAWCLREIGISSLNFSGALRQIVQGFSVFVYRSSNNILLSAAPPVLGSAVGQAALASFVPAEKVIRGVVGFVSPVLTALFPHYARNLAGTSSARTLRDAWIVICLIALAGTCAALILWGFGPILLLVVLGRQYEASAGLIQLFAWIIPLRMANQAFGVILLIPAKKDRIASILLTFFSAVSLTLGGLLASKTGPAGMVIGFLVSEGMLFLSLFIVSLKLHYKCKTTCQILR